MFRRKGTIVEWNDDRGFGYIAPAKGGERVFCHVRSFRNLVQRPARGQVFTYHLAKDMGGRRRARLIQPLDASLRSPDPSVPAEPARGSSRIAACLGGLGLMLALTALVYFGRLPWLVFPWYFGASLVTFAAFGWDQAGAWLNALTLAGGWPGGWLAMTGNRYAPRTRLFRRVFWCAVLLNLLALGVVAYGGRDAWGIYMPGAQSKAHKQP